MLFKNLHIGQDFEFAKPQLDFDLNKRFRKISARKYQHVGFSNEAGNNLKDGPVFTIGSNRAKVSPVVLLEIDFK